MSDYRLIPFLPFEPPAWWKALEGATDTPTLPTLPTPSRGGPPPMTGDGEAWWAQPEFSGPPPGWTES